MKTAETPEGNNSLRCCLGYNNNRLHKGNEEETEIHHTEVPSV